MSYRIVQGRPVKGNVSTTVAPPEVTARADAPAVDDLACPVCGREYKTEGGLTRHMADKH